MKMAKVSYTFLILILVSLFVAYNAEGVGNQFIPYPNGTVMDKSTGLMWAAKDNGYDITWYDAKKYCKNSRLGGHTDWRMPTLDELESIYDACKLNQNGYHVDGLIEITASCPWSSETRGTVEAATYFFYAFGIECWMPKYISTVNRILPVRDVK